MENKREELIHAYNMEKGEMTERFEREKDELNADLVGLQRERDEQLIVAENDKQQVGVNGSSGQAIPHSEL